MCEKSDEPQFNIEATELLVHIVASELWPQGERQHTNYGAGAHTYNMKRSLHKL